MENNKEQQEKIKLSENTDNKKYVDMTQEELITSIKEQEDFIKLCYNVKDDLSEIEKLKEEVKKENERIKEQYEIYKERIANSKNRLSKDKQDIKRIDKRIKQTIKYKEQQESLLKIIKNIKQKLKDNPNYYKEVLN